jgi:hypothetical protein
VIDEEIRLLAIGMAPGENRGSLICPACGGGASKDKAFSVAVTTDGAILYNCHRATCSFAGVVRSGVRSDGDSSGTPRPVPARPTAPYPRDLLPAVIEKRIEELYGINRDTLEEFEVQWHAPVARHSRVVIPIVGPPFTFGGWAHRGYEYRLLPPYVHYAKSMHYREEDVVWAGLFALSTPEQFTGVIVVEDSWSAMKVAQEMPGWAGYALMGTHMTVEHVIEINQLTKDWYLCLDRDATLKAIGYLQKYRHLGAFSVCPLEKDIKFLTEPEILEVLDQ